MSPCGIGILQMVQSLPAPLPAGTLPSTGNGAPVARRVRIIRRRSSSEPPEISNAGLRRRRLRAMSRREPATSLRFSRQRAFVSDTKTVIVPRSDCGPLAHDNGFDAPAWEAEVRAEEVSICVGRKARTYRVGLSVGLSPFFPILARPSAAPVGQGHAQAGAARAMQMCGLVVEWFLIHIAKCRSTRGAPTGS